MDCQNFLQEAQRFLRHVSDPNSKRIDVGLHGRHAKWSLEFAKDPLGVEQPVLVGKYTIQVKRSHHHQDSAIILRNDMVQDDEDEDDPNAAPPPPTKTNNSSLFLENISSSRQQLNITLFISYNQPYDVPALDFIATTGKGQPVNDVDELRHDFEGMSEKLLDAFEIDTAAIAEAEARMEKDDEEESSSQHRSRILRGASAPRISRMIHEVLNIPVFCVHACDTISHFKMMKIAKIMERRDHHYYYGTEKDIVVENDFSQSPIDVVLALYGKFIGLE